MHLQIVPEFINADQKALAPEPGAGVAVVLGDLPEHPGQKFYVIAPTPAALSGGVFEQTATLRTALEYRDYLSQAIIDQNLAETVRELAHSSDEGDTNAIAGNIALSLLNEGWGWEHRKPSH
jgi:hypothetical protein